MVYPLKILIFIYISISTWFATLFFFRSVSPIQEKGFPSNSFNQHSAIFKEIKMIIQHLKRRDAHSIIYSTCINSQNVILNYYNKSGADSDYRKVRWKGEKSGKRCEKSGKYWIKSRNREFEEVQIFSCIRACKYLYFAMMIIYFTL